MVIILSTWLFYIDKLNQDGWVTMVLSVTGMRVVNEVSAMYKDIRTSAPALPKKGK
jgi:hypothetical protein